MSRKAKRQDTTRLNLLVVKATSELLEENMTLGDHSSLADGVKASGRLYNQLLKELALGSELYFIRPDGERIRVMII